MQIHESMALLVYTVLGAQLWQCVSLALDVKVPSGHVKEMLLALSSLLNVGVVALEHSSAQPCDCLQRHRAGQVEGHGYRPELSACPLQP